MLFLICRVPQGMNKALAIVQIWLHIIPFAPFVPGFQKHQIIFRIFVCTAIENMQCVFLEAFRIRMGENRPSFAAAGGMVPVWEQGRITLNIRMFNMESEVRTTPYF